jgi:bifunctional non-homologous end joining protein LigD
MPSPTPPIVESTALYFRAGSSDKVYTVAIHEAAGGFHVVAANGKRGGTLTPRPQTQSPVPFDEARAIYAATVNKKLKEGYQPGDAICGYVPPARDIVEIRGQCQLLNAVDEDASDRYVNDDAYMAQPKEDGVRMMVVHTSDGPVALNRSGVPTGAPAAVLTAVATLPVGAHLDGECVGEQLRVFDCLHSGVADLRTQDTETRYEAASTLVAAARSGAVSLVPTTRTQAEKRAMVAQVRAADGEGVVFKRKRAPYTPGRPASGGDHIKLKFWKTATCRVAPSPKARANKNSIALEVRNEAGVWTPIGNVTVKANQAAPQSGAIVEVKYLYAFPGGSLFQPELKMERTDVGEEACLMNQLKYKAGTQDRSEDDDGPLPATPAQGTSNASPRRGR